MKTGDIVFLKKNLTKEFISLTRERVFGYPADEDYFKFIFSLKYKTLIIRKISEYDDGEKILSITGPYKFPMEFFTVNNSRQLFIFEDEL